jgi:hypothetical protein
MSPRIQQLQAFLAEDPNDPFLLYSLALEYVVEQPTEASRLFSELLMRFPEYLATYYQAALLKIHQADLESAKEILLRGIALASAQKNLKTANELRHLLEGVEDE